MSPVYSFLVLLPLSNYLLLEENEERNNLKTWQFLAYIFARLGEGSPHIKLRILTSSQPILSQKMALM